MNHGQVIAGQLHSHLDMHAHTDCLRLCMKVLLMNNCQTEEWQKPIVHGATGYITMWHLFFSISKHCGLFQFTDMSI